MISIIAHGEAKNDTEYMEEYSDGEDHAGQRNEIVIRYPTEFEPDCNYVIEYEELPFPDSTIKLNCNDIDKVELKSPIFEDDNYVVNEIDTQNHFFNHTDSRIIQIFIEESIPAITELFTQNDELFVPEKWDNTHEKDYYYQGPNGECLYHLDKNEHLLELSRIVRYNDLYREKDN